ncbi:hypothetical protein D3880_13570 [Pseudomonas cavernae]|uniref:Uncharacterized protein n=1 Tax=Pseudomonas cavernae TaxID=2320867 RepID=A0A385Z2J8_9PSED|nr:hypothetical protein [Pseudomonas cavernae]AYC33316.1 hypothetical protein D3880_13570 [Pseudomonas cavernae]
MSHDRNQPGDDRQLEQQLLAHFRQHSQDEPSAELDARILAAARAAQQQSAPAMSWSERLHAWLFGAGARQHWSLAVAGLACLGIGVSLTWRTLEQAPPSFDAAAPAVLSAPTPASPASAPLQREALPEAPAQSKLLAAPPAAAKRELRQQDMTAASPAAELADQLPAEPQRSLQRLLELRRAGQHEQAEQLQRQLLRDYPQLDIAAELKRLEQAP